MAKKGKKSTPTPENRPIIHPRAAGIDIGIKNMGCALDSRAAQPVQKFSALSLGNVHEGVAFTTTHENSPLGCFRGKFKRPFPPAACAHPLLPLVPALGSGPHAPGRAHCQGAPVLPAPPGATSRHRSARGWPAYRQQPSGCCAGNFLRP